MLSWHNKKCSQCFTFVKTKSLFHKKIISEWMIILEEVSISWLSPRENVQARNVWGHIQMSTITSKIYTSSPLPHLMAVNTSSQWQM